MERKMAEVENDNVVARKINVGAGLQPAKVKVKGHSEQAFGAVAYEESPTSNPFAYQEGQGEASSTPEFVAQN